MAPQSLQIRPQPPIPGLELPAGMTPGENGKPMGMPPSSMSMLPFGEPGMMSPPRMPGMVPPPRNNAPPSPGLKGPPKTPSLKAPKPVSQSPAQKPPDQQSEPYKSPEKPHKSPSSPSRPSSPKPSGTGAPKLPRAASSRLSNFDYLNSTTRDKDLPGAMPQSAPPMPGAPPPMPPTPAPMQQQGLPSVGDIEPDWGSGSGTHLSDDGADWGSHPMMSDPDWNSGQRADGGPDWNAGGPDMFDTDPLHSLSRRKGFIFRRLSLRR